MMRYKQGGCARNIRLIAALLVIGAGGVFAAKNDMSMDVKGFRVPEYDSKGVMTSQLFGERAEILGDGEVKITALRVEFYKEGKTVATVTSPYCFYNRDTREAHSDAPVAADLERLTMRGRGYLLKSSEHTVRVLNESHVTVHNALDELNAAASAGTNQTVITSRELFLDYKGRKARFEKDVHVVDPKMEMFCNELEIQFEQDQQINWISAAGGVKIRSEEREALAGNALYEVKSDEFVLQDNPRMFDGKNILSGEKIRFWRGEGRMVCEPSARLIVYSDRQLTSGFFEK